MEILLVNIFVVLIEAVIIKIFISKPSNAVKAYLLVVFAQLFILHAFLDPNKMADLPGYLEYYEVYAKNSLHESIVVGYVGVKMEPGWILFCKILSFINKNPRFLLAVTSLIIVGSYCITIRKYSSIPWLSVFLFLCTTFDQSLFVLRQHTAMAICLLTIPYIIKRDLKLFIVVWLLAFGCHVTSILFLPMYFVYPLDLEKRYWLYMIVGTILGVLLISFVFEWVFHNLWYNSYEDTSAEEKAGANLTGFFMILSSLLLYLVSIKWNFKRTQGAEKVFFLMISLGAILSLAGVGFSPTNRLVKYFMIASIFLIPISISKFKSLPVRCAIILVVVILYLKLFFSPSNLTYIGDYKLSFQ